MENNLEWTSLGIGDYGLYQPLEGFRFSIDAVLLAHYAKVSPGDFIMDIGCGSGIIPHLMAIYNPECRFLGIDIQAPLIELAKASRDRNHFAEERLAFQCQDCRQIENQWRHQFDHITCNPPFFKVGNGALNPNSSIAIGRHELTQTLPDLFQAAYAYLKHRGQLWLIHRAERLDEIFAVAHDYRLKPSTLRPLYANQKAKTAKLILCSFTKDGQNSLKLEAPLYEYNEDGTYNEEINTWYQEGSL